MYSTRFILASIFCYSTLIQGMENNLVVLAQEALSDSYKCALFCDLCNNGAYNEKALIFLVKEHDKLNSNNQKTLLPGDETYVFDPQNSHEIIANFSRFCCVEQMILSLKVSRSKQQQSIKLPDHKIENNRK